MTCICSNILFGFNKYGKQKQYDRNKPKDNNSLSIPTNPNRVEAYVKALILAGIANEIMLPDLHTVVTYSNDGYAQSGIRIISFIKSQSMNLCSLRTTSQNFLIVVLIFCIILMMI